VLAAGSTKHDVAPDPDSTLARRRAAYRKWGTGPQCESAAGAAAKGWVSLPEGDPPTAFVHNSGTAGNSMEAGVGAFAHSSPSAGYHQAPTAAAQPSSRMCGPRGLSRPPPAGDRLGHRFVGCARGPESPKKPTPSNCCRHISGTRTFWGDFLCGTNGPVVRVLMDLTATDSALLRRPRPPHGR